MLHIQGMPIFHSFAGILVVRFQFPLRPVYWP